MHTQKLIKAIHSYLKKSHRPRISRLGSLPVLTLITALLITGGSAAAFTTNENLRHVVVSKASELVGAKVDVKDDTEQPAPVITPATTPKPPAEKKDDIASDPTIIKYSTSGDPRSTSYSLTPPKPNPAAVDIRITRPGQVAAGTLISYAPDKQGQPKAYYGGGLIISPASLTYSLSSPAQQPFTVSTPGGVIADGMPSAPWYESSGEFFAAYDSSAYTGPGSSWNMIIDDGYPNPSIGTYTVHIATSHHNTPNESIEYDGFVTINVVP